MNVFAPKFLEVSEDGIQTSSFALSLGAAPLSAVTIMFRSAYGGAEFSPSAVMFTYLNFNQNVSIKVTGVDDDIDQGDFHGDRVLMSITTEDSLFECLEADRPACGLGALYADL